MRRLFTLCACLLLVVLSGCATTVYPALPLEDASAATQSSRHPVVAIDSHGVRHYAWSQCDIGCKLIYKRMQLSAQTGYLEFIPAVPGDFIIDPDIVATPSGTTYLAASICPDVGTQCIDYIVSIPESLDPLPLLTRLTPAGMTSRSGYSPLLVANGDQVYALYYTNHDGDLGVDLRYRRLDQSDSDHPISTSANKVVVNARAAVDTTATLHVAYEYLSTVSDYQALFYYSLPWGGSANLEFMVNDVSTNDLYSPPDVAVGSNNSAYVVFAFLDNGDNILRFYENPVSNPATSTDWLNGSTGQGWQISGGPRVSSSKFVTFAASNTATGAASEIWLMQNDSTINQLTSSADSAAQPEITALFPYTVVAWRSDAACGGAVYAWDTFHATAQQIQPDLSAQCEDAKLDLATNGHFVAAAWLQSNQAEAEHAIAWTAFSVEASFAPVLLR